MEDFLSPRTASNNDVHHDEEGPPISLERYPILPVRLPKGCCQGCQSSTWLEVSDAPEAVNGGHEPELSQQTGGTARRPAAPGAAQRRAKRGPQSLRAPQGCAAGTSRGPGQAGAWDHTRASFPYDSGTCWSAPTPPRQPPIKLHGP